MTASTLAFPPTEVDRLRAELAELHRLVAALVDALDPKAEVAYRRALAVEAFARGRELGQREGYERCAADYERLWRETAAPVARGAKAAVA